MESLEVVRPTEHQGLSRNRMGTMRSAPYTAPSPSMAFLTSELWSQSHSAKWQIINIAFRGTFNLIFPESTWQVKEVININSLTWWCGIPATTMAGFWKSPVTRGSWGRAAWLGPLPKWNFPSDAGTCLHVRAYALRPRGVSAFVFQIRNSVFGHPDFLQLYESSPRARWRKRVSHPRRGLLVQRDALVLSPSGWGWSVSTDSRVKLERPAKTHHHKG